MPLSRNAAGPLVQICIRLPFDAAKQTLKTEGNDLIISKLCRFLRSKSHLFLLLLDYTCCLQFPYEPIQHLIHQERQGLSYPPKMPYMSHQCSVSLELMTS